MMEGWIGKVQRLHPINGYNEMDAINELYFIVKFLHISTKLPKIGQKW